MYGTGIWTKIHVFEKKDTRTGVKLEINNQSWSGLVRTKSDLQFVFKELDLEHDSWFQFVWNQNNDKLF